MSRRYSLAHVTVLGCPPPEAIGIAARCGYDFVGLRTIPLGLAGEPRYVLEDDPVLFRATRDALRDTGVRLHDIEDVIIEAGLGNDVLLSGGGARNPLGLVDNNWKGFRALSDAQIRTLAENLVKEIRQRGPFLSLSEFVNRRLDPSDKNLSVKGALQAALDDDAVSINEGFRNKARRFSAGEISKMKPAFPEALAGPVAYGSAAYVDQADILRHCAELLTPRGDTFVIRTYGDALDASGKVEARAWCEAVIQRVPEYLDSADQPHVKQAALLARQKTGCPQTALRIGAAA